MKNIIINKVLLMKKIKIIFTIFLLTVTTYCFAATDRLDFKSAEQEENYHLLTQELRCPQCQNNSIADSNATIAVDMRAKVFELLDEGKSEKDIIQYMVDRYGDFVTYDPPFTMSTAILWIVPFTLMFFGLFLVFKGKKKRTVVETSTSNIKTEDDVSLSSEEKERLQKLLKKDD